MERSPRVTPGTFAERNLRRALGRFASATVCLAGVDPVTTEIVRMRCAHHHDCGT
jgi:hypothetical protein